MLKGLPVEVIARAPYALDEIRKELRIADGLDNAEAANQLRLNVISTGAPECIDVADAICIAQIDSSGLKASRCPT